MYQDIVIREHEKISPQGLQDNSINFAAVVRRHLQVSAGILPEPQRNQASIAQPVERRGSLMSRDSLTQVTTRRRTAQVRRSNRRGGSALYWILPHSGRAAVPGLIFLERA